MLHFIKNIVARLAINPESKIHVGLSIVEKEFPFSTYRLSLTNMYKSLYSFSN